MLRYKNNFPLLFWIFGFAFIMLLITISWLPHKNETPRSARSSEAVPWQYRNSWQLIGDKDGGEVYSAYFVIAPDTSDNTTHDTLASGMLRIYTVLPTDFQQVMNCILRYNNTATTEVVAAQTSFNLEHNNTIMAIYTIMCPLNITRANYAHTRRPQSVALVYTSAEQIIKRSPFVTISYPRNKADIYAESKPLLAVCMPPLHSSYSNTLRIAEFVEMYRLLGATHFYFYHQNASANVLLILEHYRQMGVADVLDWNLQNHKRVYRGALLAQINECITRANVVDNTRFAAIVGLNEFIIPLLHKTLLEFLRIIDNGRYASFLFRNICFYKEHCCDTFTTPPRTNNRILRTQISVRRTEEMMPEYDRSKSVVNTRLIIEMLHHHLLDIVPGAREALVFPRSGLLFHYRDHCKDCKVPLVPDFSAQRFGSLIWDRVDETCAQVFKGYNTSKCPIE